jgi:hypothetical protein
VLCNPLLHLGVGCDQRIYCRGEPGSNGLWILEDTQQGDVSCGNLFLEPQGVFVKQRVQLVREGELDVGQLQTLLHAAPLSSPTMPLASPHSWATLTATASVGRKILQGKLALAAPPSVSSLDLLLLKLTAGLHQASPLGARQGIAKLHNVPTDRPYQALATTTDG